jgi:hypothetical protein
VTPKRCPVIAWVPSEGPDHSVAASRNRPWNECDPGTGRHPSSKPPLLSAARLALAGADRKTLASPDRIRRFRRCTGRLNATQPEILAISSPLHTWIGLPVQGSVSGRQHRCLIHSLYIKLPLTLWSYSGKRGRGRGGSEILFNFRGVHLKRTFEPNPTKILGFLVSFEPEARKPASGKMERISGWGH